jgi:energy-coupling factor transporter ATP-binding protein EcfA2
VLAIATPGAAPRKCWPCALDWANGEPVIELLRAAAHERQATVLVVAHDARIIPYVDRVFHMEDGCIREVDEDVSTSGPRLAPVNGDLATNGDHTHHYPGLR